MRNGNHRTAACRAIVLLVGALLGTEAAAAQAAPEARQPVQVPADSTVAHRVSPGGAFFRSLLLPGWGQAAVGSYGRGGFYFATETAVTWMLFKTGRRRSFARSVTALRIGEVEAFHMAQGITDPDSLLALVDADEGVMDARDLEEVRSQQFEDWLAFGIFMVFLGGADAFVAAHLADFPEALTTGLQVLPGGRVEVSVGFTPPWDRPGG